MPNNINILTGKNSQFWFMSDYAHLSRKGCMTEHQKEHNNKGSYKDQQGNDLQIIPESC